MFSRRLHDAARLGKLEVVEELLTDENINSRCPWGFSPLNVACYRGHDKVVKFLLDAGADVQLDDGQDWTPLHAACAEGHASTVKLLLSYGADKCVNVASGNRRGTPLFATCKSKSDRHGNVVKLLIGAGADVNTTNAQGRTPLMEASAKGFYMKVTRLLDAGADIHAVDCNGLSALHMAVGFPTIVELLIDFGADVNLVDKRGEMPVQRRDLSLGAISILLEHGAGAEVPCLRHKKCTGSIVSCLYKASRISAKRGSGPQKLNIMEKHLIKMDVAGLYAGRGCALVPIETNYWDNLSRDEFRVECETELSTMKTVKVPNSNVTYFDALIQRPYALKHVHPPSLERCRRNFLIYGELIWSRFLLGCRKLSLVEKAVDFFTMAEAVPYLAPEIVYEILSYLSEMDLKVVITVYKSAKRRPSISERKKRIALSPDSATRVMKHLKVA